VYRGTVMASYNRIIMMGNLTRDPEFKQLNTGQNVCRFGLASNRQFKNKQTGTMSQEVCFVDVDVWGPQAETCRQYLQKGRGVLVEGRLKLDSWQDQEGNRRSKHSIVAERVTFLGTGAQADDSDEVAGGDFVPARPEDQEKKSAAPADDTVKPKREKHSKQTGPAGEVDFKDQRPFEEDLPF
jgi:single-strand DNA-binding protein